MDHTEEIERVIQRLEAGLRVPAPETSRAAVFIPIVAGTNGPEVVFEVRAAHLKRQPGEVCLPGGHIETGESARDAAIRETCEELLIQPHQLSSVLDMGRIDGPGGMPLRVFVGVLRDYTGTFDAEEVGSTFTVPVSWLESHEPTVYRGSLVLEPPEDLPWELIPEGRNYPWHKRVHEIPFYDGTNPLVWGFTARVIRLFVEYLKKGAKLR